MAITECITHYGGRRLVPTERLTFRPSVYAIMRDGDQVLLLNTRHTGNYSLPGGGVEVGETLEQALRREVREETGLSITAISFFRFEEQFFYYDPADVAFHSFLFFYLCKPASEELHDDNPVEEEVENPRWVKVGELRVQDFHNHGQLILDAVHQAG